MKRIILLLLLSGQLIAGTPGIFRGVLGEVADRGPEWVFVRSPNNKFRVVNIARATVSYADEIPVARRNKVAARSLLPGTEVRVTAEEDEHSGEWHASEVEILKLANQKRQGPD
ncbi:MAG: hypothetical protein ACE14M_11700 [Terriglobales bacterium]